MKLKVIFILLVSFFTPFMLQAQKTYIAFQHVTLDHGLSSNMIRSFCKDKPGFVWIGTHNGLNRYNGYSVKTYMPDPFDSNAILGRDIMGIADDWHGHLWIITEDGLNRYDQQKDKFYHYFTNTDTTLGKGFNRILIDKVTGHIWLSSNKFVTIRFDPKNNKTYIYKHDPKDPSSIGPNGVIQFIQDNADNIWHSSWQYGISRYNRATDNFTHFLHDPKDNTSIIKEPIHTLVADGKNDIWVGTFSNTSVYSIARLDQTTGKFKRYRSSIDGSPDYVYHSTADLNGNVWFASLSEGLFLYDLKKETFTKFKHKSTDSETITETVVAHLYTDYNNNLWVGTLNKGANVANLNFKDVTFYFLPYQNKDEDIRIETMEEDELKNIWIGSPDGLFLIDKKSNTVKRFVLDKNNQTEPIDRLLNTADGKMIVWSHHKWYQIDITSLKVKKVTKAAFNFGQTFKVHKDQLNNIWLLCWNEILFYKDGKFDLPPVKIPINEAKEVFIYANIFEEDGNLWIGFNHTFLKINIHTLSVTDLLDEYFKTSNIVSTPGFHMQKGKFVINASLGKFTFNTDSNKFYLLETPFLRSDEIIPKFSFYTGNDIFFSTYRGIFLYNIRSRKYSHPSLTHNDRVSPNIVLSASNGKIYLPSNNGLLVFRPELVEDLAIKMPTIVIEEFYLFNQPVKVNQPGSPLTNHINYTNELVLDHKQSIFTFELTMLNFDDVAKNQYAYILEGFEENWNYIGSSKSASYTNIPAGKYTFKYKGLDKNGTWSHTRELKVVILPPFWETWWFRLLTLIFLSLAIFFIVNRRKNKLFGSNTENLHQQKK